MEFPLFISHLSEITVLHCLISNVLKITVYSILSGFLIVSVGMMINFSVNLTGPQGAQTFDQKFSGCVCEGVSE